MLFLVINSASEAIRENIQISAKEDYIELKKDKPWINKG
jgi:hypothetical protein